MSISLLICVFVEDFNCVGSSNPSDLTPKGLVVRFSIFDFYNNSTFLKQFRREFILLHFLNLLLDLGLNLDFRKK